MAESVKHYPYHIHVMAEAIRDVYHHLSEDDCVAIAQICEESLRRAEYSIEFDPPGDE